MDRTSLRMMDGVCNRFDSLPGAMTRNSPTPLLLLLYNWIAGCKGFWKKIPRRLFQNLHSHLIEIPNRLWRGQDARSLLQSAKVLKKKHRFGRSDDKARGSVSFGRRAGFLQKHRERVQRRWRLAGLFGIPRIGGLQSSRQVNTRPPAQVGQPGNIQ